MEATIENEDEKMEATVANYTSKVGENSSEIEEDNARHAQQEPAQFRIDVAALIGIGSFSLSWCISSITLDVTSIVVLMCVLVLVFYMLMQFYNKKKCKEHEKETKDNALKYLKVDKMLVIKLLQDVTATINPEMQVTESDQPVQTHSIRTLKKEFIKLNENIAEMTIQIENGYSGYRKAILDVKSGEWDYVMLFRKLQEQLTRQCDEITSNAYALKKKFKLTDSSILAESTRQLAECLGNQLENDKNSLKLYKLPLQLTNSQNKVRRFEYGTETGKSHRHVMFVGMTGAGKSLLINNIINYIYGVEVTDNFRFKLIVEDEEINEREPGSSESQAYSMTSCVSAFTLYYQKGFRIPYSITLIDTPGFGDTRNIRYDEMIFNQINFLFTNESICRTSEINCIGLVMNSSLPRITKELNYIVDQVLQLFAKDIKENIFLLFTFADGQPPPVLEVVNELKIPHAEGRQFKFNNSALYAEGEEFYWEFGVKSLKTFFDAISETPSISLTLTKENLEEREGLRIALENLRPGIEKGIAHLEKIRYQTEILKTIKGDILKSKNYKMTTTVKKEVAVRVDHSITNCNVCHHTCHDPCGIKGNVKKSCSAMKMGFCKVCTGKCHWEKHTNGWHKYELKDFKETTTINELMNKYHVSIRAKDAKKEILMKLIKEYREMNMSVFDLIEQANNCSNRLDSISLRPNYLNNVEYIQLLIKAEKKKTRNVSQRNERIKQLENLKNLAMLLQQIKEDPESIRNKVQRMEQEINDIILETLDGIDDDATYKEAKEESMKLQIVNVTSKIASFISRYFADKSSKSDSQNLQVVPYSSI